MFTTEMNLLLLIQHTLTPLPLIVGLLQHNSLLGQNPWPCDVYPLKNDKQFVKVLQNNIRRQGAFFKLISDRAQVEISNKVQNVLQNYIIQNWQSEPHQQHQNAAEWCNQDAKRLANTLLDHPGAPLSLWFLALTYVCMILNHTAYAFIGNAIIIQVLTGATPDISALLQFDFYEPVYYKMEESHFPSMSNEKSGYSVGISEHVGHALTFMILTDDTKKIIYWSVVHTATDPATRNLRVNETPDHELEEHIQSHNDDPVNEEDDQGSRMSIVHPEDLVWRIFGITQEDDQSNQICIVKAIKDHQDHVDNSTTNVKFRCSINNEAYEDILLYNQIFEDMTKDDDADIICKFKDIIGHKGTLKKGHKGYKGSPYNVTVL